MLFIQHKKILVSPPSYALKHPSSVYTQTLKYI